MAQDGFKYKKKCCQFPNSMLVQIASFYIYTFVAFFTIDFFVLFYLFFAFIEKFFAQIFVVLHT